MSSTLLPRMKQSPYLALSWSCSYSSVCSIAMFMNPSRHARIPAAAGSGSGGRECSDVRVRQPPRALVRAVEVPPDPLRAAGQLTSILDARVQLDAHGAAQNGAKEVGRRLLRRRLWRRGTRAASRCGRRFFGHVGRLLAWVEATWDGGRGRSAPRVRNVSSGLAAAPQRGAAAEHPSAGASRGGEEGRGERARGTAGLLKPEPWPFSPFHPFVPEKGGATSARY